MNKKDLHDFIKELSIKDKKTLLQKALKTAEECGELAKAVLPYEEAPQSLHKFSDQKKILEECADVILCALSVAYNLGADKKQINDMLWKKCEYWGSLQSRENKTKRDLPFEIHLTVDNKTNFNQFKKICTYLNIKAIQLDLITKDKNILDEMMTSSKFFGTNSSAYEELNRIKNALEENGIVVIREKIETVFWHPSAPSKLEGNKKMHKNGYFEAHFEYEVSNKNLKQLLLISRKNKMVVSKNINKKNIYMLTLRSYNSVLEDFQKEVQLIEQELIKKGFIPLEKVLIEFSLYDTNISHDKQWINS